MKKGVIVLIIGIFLISSVKAICPSPMPEGMFICADIEEPDNVDGELWVHKYDYFDRGTEFNWLVTSNFSSDGNFALESMDPNIQDSTISFFRNVSWNDELFIRYDAKFPLDWEGEATDYNNDGSGPDGGANHFRMEGGSNRDIEASFGGGWLHTTGSIHWYDTGVKWNIDMYLEDNQWHEYAIYIKMPSSNISSDGIFRLWRDSNGEYDISNSFFNWENTSQTTEFFAVGHMTPCYYKGPVEPIDIGTKSSTGNWKFWLDDIQAWDRIPGTSVSKCGAADTSGNEIIEIGELINYIQSWKDGTVSIGDLISAISKWKNGC